MKEIIIIVIAVMMFQPNKFDGETEYCCKVCYDNECLEVSCAVLDIIKTINIRG